LEKDAEARKTTIPYATRLKLRCAGRNRVFMRFL
jgi:hypothetical protein